MVMEGARMLFSQLVHKKVKFINLFHRREIPIQIEIDSTAAGIEIPDAVLVERQPKRLQLPSSRKEAAQVVFNTAPDENDFDFYCGCRSFRSFRGETLW